MSWVAMGVDLWGEFIYIPQPLDIYLAFYQKQPMSSGTHKVGGATERQNNARMNALAAIPCVAVPT